MSSAHAFGALAAFDERVDAREEVFYRTRAVTTQHCNLPLQIVNISANGFMARSESDFTIGDVLIVKLPVVGPISAEVRWALGGRIGCQFDQMIGVAPYLELLAELVSTSR